MNLMTQMYEALKDVDDDYCSTGVITSKTLDAVLLAIEAAEKEQKNSEASVINAWKYSYGRSKFGEGF